MSSFVLCDDESWEDLYQPEYYKWFRIKEAEDLLGHASIRVYVHIDWQEGYPDDRVEYLEQQIEILARFGYIKLIYKGEDGKEAGLVMDSTQVIESPHINMFESIKTGLEEAIESNAATVVYGGDE